MNIHWGNFLSGGILFSGVLAVIIFLLRYAILNKIRVIAETEINKHRHELDMHGERIKYDLQKEFLQAQITTNQKHKVYSKLYTLLMKADGAVSGLRGLRYEATFEEYSVEDFVEYLQKNDVKTEKRDEILAAFMRNKEDGVRIWGQYKRLLEFQAARQKITAAKNYWLINELYVSVIVSDVVREFTTKLWHLYARTEEPDRSEPYEKVVKLQEELKALLEKLKNLMGSELRPAA